jgi:hypothetical protein
MESLRPFFSDFVLSSRAVTILSSRAPEGNSGPDAEAYVDLALKAFKYHYEDGTLTKTFLEKLNSCLSPALFKEFVLFFSIFFLFSDCPLLTDANLYNYL